MKTWLKGGLWGLAAGIILTIITALIAGVCFNNNCGGGFGTMIPSVYLAKIFHSCGGNLSYNIILFGNILIGPVVGIIIGLIIQKIKSKKRKK